MLAANPVLCEERHRTSLVDAIRERQWTVNVIEIWTKPLARRTLSRVRGRQFVWDDARPRLQVIIWVCA